MCTQQLPSESLSTVLVIDGGLTQWELVQVFTTCKEVAKSVHCHDMQVFWIVRAGIQSMTRQLAAGLAAATGLQQRQAWATAAAEADVLDVLSAHLLTMCQSMVFNSAAGTLGALVQVAEAQAALLTAAASIAAATALAPHVYASATAAAVCCVVVGLTVQLKRVPPVGDKRFSGGGICSGQSTSQRLSEASTLLAALAAKEAAVQPGLLLLSQVSAFEMVCMNVVRLARSAHEPLPICGGDLANTAWAWLASDESNRGSCGCAAGAAAAVHITGGGACRCTEPPAGCSSIRQRL